MSKPELPNVKDLSLASLDVGGAIKVDWNYVDEFGDEFVILPSITRDVLEEHGHAPEEDTDEALEQAIVDFRSSDEYLDWRDRFNPVMNYLWPVPLEGENLQHMADLVKAHAPNCCLVAFQDNGVTYSGIAMTAGGTDLSRDLAAAYVCCGHVPPMTILESAAHSSRKKHAKLLADCLDRVSGHFEQESERSARLATQLRESAEPSANAFAP